jgi:hypothetical protein
VSELHQQIIDLYHEVLPALPRIKVWTSKRSKALDARILERLAEGKGADAAPYWRALFETVADSDFLCGRSSTFRADLEWIINAENFVKIIEGRYAPRPVSQSGGAQHVR